MVLEPGDPELQRIGHKAVAVDLPGHGERSCEEAPTTFEGRVGAIVGWCGLAMCWWATRVVALTSRMPQMPCPTSFRTFAIWPQAYPRGRTWPEAMALRSGGTMADFDAAGLLGFLSFHEDGSMTVRSADAAREKFFNDCDDHSCSGHSSGFVQSGAARPRARRCTYRTFGRRPASQLHSLSAGSGQERWYADLVAERLGWRLSRSIVRIRRFSVALRSWRNFSYARPRRLPADRWILGEQRSHSANSSG